MVSSLSAHDLTDHMFVEILLAAFATFLHYEVNKHLTVEPSCEEKSYCGLPACVR